MYASISQAVKKWKVVHTLVGFPSISEERRSGDRGSSASAGSGFSSNSVIDIGAISTGHTSINPKAGGGTCASNCSTTIDPGDTGRGEDKDVHLQPLFSPPDNPPPQIQTPPNRDHRILAWAVFSVFVERHLWKRMLGTVAARTTLIGSE
jgi:hypothetical protein